VKIKGIHETCGREVLVSQIVDSNGHCPWDGEAFNKDYTALLAEALAHAQIAGTALQDKLSEIADMHGTLRIDEGSVLGDLRAELDRVNANRAAVTAR
jgi:hypothetical protein